MKATGIERHTILTTIKWSLIVQRFSGVFILLALSLFMTFSTEHFLTQGNLVNIIHHLCDDLRHWFADVFPNIIQAANYVFKI
jgi:hypothetical protein